MTPDPSDPAPQRTVVRSLDEAVESIVRASAGRALLLVGLTGSPGAGKSTIAEELRASIPGAVVLGIDGYHLPQARLRELGRRERMGAPDTFDTAGFVGALRRLRLAQPGDVLRFASFDRAIEEPVPDGTVLTIGDPTVVVIEGNYLLLGEEGWGEVAPLLDLTFHLRIDPVVRRTRLVARHLRFGKTLDDALAWSDGPDERNAERIEAAAERADAILSPTPERPLRLLHLSDTHLLGDPGSRYNRVIDTRASLAAVLDAHAAIQDIDAVIVSGDLSGDGSADSYSALREILTPWCEQRGAALVLALGNHDDRENFGSPAPWNTETLVGGTRIVALDSSVPGGASWGLLTEPTLAWLRGRFLTDPLTPTVLVLHHPPIDAVTPLHRRMGLANPHDLWEAVEGAPVLAVLSGHWHHAFVDTTTPAPVVVAPGAANRTDVLAGPAHERSVAASGASIVEVLPRGVRVTSTEIDAPHRGTELFDVSGEVLADWLRRLGFPR